MATVSAYLNDAFYYGTTGIFGNLFGFKPSPETNPQYYPEKYPEYATSSSLTEVTGTIKIVAIAAGVYFLYKVVK